MAAWELPLDPQERYRFQAASHHVTRSGVEWMGWVRAGSVRGGLDLLFTTSLFFKLLSNPTMHLVLYHLSHWHNLHTLHKAK